MKNAFRIFFSLLFALLSSVPSMAAPPKTLSYQGVLTNAAAVPVNSTQSITFSLYALPIGGLPLWSETQPSVTVNNGLFAVTLGSVTPITLPFDATYYLGVQVGADQEMSPRQPLAASAYAITALSVDATGTVPGSTVVGPISAAGAGTNNTFVGAGAGNATSTGNTNVAFGSIALAALTTGSANTALGVQALSVADSSANNTALGRSALRFTTGGNNIGIGAFAGSLIATGNNNIAIGNNGTGSDASTIRIGSSGFGPYRAFVEGIRGITPASSDVLPVIIDVNGQLGTSTFAAISPIREPGANNTFGGTGAGNTSLTGDGNVAFGRNALPAVTTGIWNAATGYRSMLLNQDGNFNTANGLEALASNVSGNNNTAVGVRALLNSTAASNIAIGANAGASLTTGGENIAIGHVGVAAEAKTTRIGTNGSQTRAFIAGVRGVTTDNADALPVGIDSAGQLGNLASIPGSLISGPIAASTAQFQNTIIGAGAASNAVGEQNTVFGADALKNATSASNNIAIGPSALLANQTGGGNTAIGRFALGQVTGSENIGIGTNAGMELTTGNYNIVIGTNQGSAGESRTIRIGSQAVTEFDGPYRAFIQGISGVTSSSGVPVFVNSSGQLGTATSSRRFKENIASMSDASAGLMRLNPVTFNYLNGLDDGQKLTQYGLIAEEVAEVYPGLVVKTPDGQAETVRYHFLTPMLLNEVQKQQRVIASQAARIDALEKQSVRMAALLEKLESSPAAER